MTRRVLLRRANHRRTSATVTTKCSSAGRLRQSTGTESSAARNTGRQPPLEPTRDHHLSERDVSRDLRAAQAALVTGSPTWWRIRPFATIRRHLPLNDSQAYDSRRVARSGKLRMAILWSESVIDGRSAGLFVDQPICAFVGFSVEFSRELRDHRSPRPKLNLLRWSASRSTMPIRLNRSPDGC